MPRTIEKTVYQIEELPESAQESAWQGWLQTGDCFTWWPEWQDSLNTFCEIAPVEYIRFDIVAGHIGCRFTNDYTADLSGVRAWKWLYNNGWFDIAAKNVQGDCTLTGYCGDCPLFEPIYALRNTPDRVPELDQLFYECLQSWVYAVRSDMEHCESFEYFLEMAEANQWEYDENGNIH